MFNIKKIIILILILLLTGCDATYNIEINDNQVKDEIIINNTNISSWTQGELSYKDVFESYKDYNIITNIEKATYTDNHHNSIDKKFYNKETIENNHNLGYRFNYTFKIEDYPKTPVLNYSYRFLNIKNDYYKLILDSGDSNGCTIFSKFSLLNNFSISIYLIY